MTHGLGVDPGPGARLAADEERALADAYAALGPMVLGYLRHLVPWEEADGLLQRVFHEVWRDEGHHDPSGGLAALLLARARDLATDHPHHRRPTDAVDGPRGAAAEDPDALAERYLQAAEVRRALSRLPDEQREVLTRAYFHHQSQSEIAACLAIPLRTVKERALEGLQGLAIQLRERRRHPMAPGYHPPLSPPRGDVPFVGPV